MSSNWYDTTSSDPKKRKGNPIEKAFNNNLREQLDGEIARMFYTGGLSFQFSKKPLLCEECLQPMKRASQSKGVSVCSDGWSDVMTVCESGPMFLKAINCEDECKDKFFMENLRIESIREIGPQNVV